MNRSETIGKLSEALSKAQACIKGASMDSKNPFFNSKYADLTSVWEACRGPLTENGLSVVQVTIPHTQPDYICLETMLTHASGEWVSGELVMKPTKSDPQSYGSCLTYMRRYSLAAIVGICPEDDDGNAASKPEAPAAKKEQPKNEQAKKEPTKKEVKEDLTTEKAAFAAHCAELALSEPEITALKKYLFKQAPTKEELAAVNEKFNDHFDAFVAQQTE